MRHEIMRCLHGSHLYGTETPDSDVDWKAIHLPTGEEVLLGTTHDTIRTSTGDDASRNGSGDVDVESHSLQKFLALAQGMKTVSVELLFAPPEQTSHMWDVIVRNRDKILNRNADAFVGYCKSQAVRYSLRGVKLKTYLEVLEYLRELPADKPVAANGDAYAALTSMEGVEVLQKKMPGGTVVPHLSVFGREVPGTISAQRALEVYEKPAKKAGARAHDAMLGGADWKAVAHSLRVAGQGIELFRDGVITFPRPEAPFLKRVRAGDMTLDAAMDVFDERLAELLDVAENSRTLRAVPDVHWIKNFLLEAHLDVVCDDYI